MESKKINQLATNVAPQSTDLTIIGDPITGVSKKITWLQVSTLIGTAANLQQVTDNGATTTNPIAIGGLTITGLATGVLKSNSGVIASVPFGAANGVATLGGDGKVPSSQLPSYVDDVVEVANYAALPAIGETGKIYITLDNNKVYRWTGSIYVEIAANNAVWGAITGTLSNQTDLQNALNTKLSSVGLSMPSGFSVSNSPLTANGTIAVTGAGVASQYIRGDGTLANFPTSGGGGSSVSYYLNGSVNQGTFAGNTYYEMSKVPVIGAGTNFTINANGYITQFITDANDPSLLEIPAGNWNFEMYFSASSGGGTPSFYVELYKYNGTTFTSIASSSAAPEGITNGTAIDLYTTALAVPTTALTLTDRLAIRVYVTHSGRTITLHTENSNLCQVITTFSTGITALNGLTAQVQYLATGTSGTDFNISSTTATHTFNLPVASATNTGKLSSTDWSTFNSKQNTITLTTTGSSGAATLVGATLNIPNYGSALSGYVPYTGATANLNLGTFGITSGGISSNGIAVSQSGGISASSGATTINGDANGIRINPVTASSNFLSFPSSGSRTYTYPNATGTLALTSDLTSYLPLTGGTLTGALNINLGSGTGLNVASDLVVFRASTGFATPRQITLAAGNGATTYLEAKGYGANYITDFGIRTYNASGTAFEVFFATSAGNVGIGTTSPTKLLSVNEGTSTTIHSIKMSNATSTTNGYMGMWYNQLRITNGATYTTSGGWVSDGAIAPTQIYLASNSNNGFITFDTSNSNISEPIERMRITSGGNVGIGTSSPNSKLEILVANSGTNQPGLEITNAANASLKIQIRTNIAEFIAGGAGNMVFSNDAAERMRITSGGAVCIGGTSYGGLGISFNQSVGQIFNYSGTGVNTNIEFKNSNGTVGYIQSNGSTTSYVTTSDYRLKEDFKILNGLEKVLAIRTYDYKWKNSNDRMDGVIAHELAEVLPYAVYGEKDAEKMQGVDYSKLVPILVKSIQELEARIKQLENK
jgi:hypothetical protein